MNNPSLQAGDKAAHWFLRASALAAEAKTIYKIFY